MTADYIPEANLTDAQNYCRNADMVEGIWCYTTDSDLRWEFCDVWRCLPIGSTSRFLCVFFKAAAAATTAITKYISTGRLIKKMPLTYLKEFSQV